MLSRYRSISRTAQHVKLDPRRVQRVSTSHFLTQPIRRNASSIAADNDNGNGNSNADASSAAAVAAEDDSPFGTSITAEHLSTTPHLTQHPNPTTSSSAVSSPQPPHPPLSSLLPSNPQHTSLRTYLAHARRLGVSATSTTYAGTVYEYIVLDSLRRIGIEVVRIGQTGDLGVDLVGYWHLPERTKRGEAPLRVVVQCKRLNRKVGPAVVRELEGAIVGGAPAGWRGLEDVVGLVVGAMPASRGVVEGLKRSRRATGWVCVEEVELEREEQGKAVQGAGGGVDESESENERNGEGVRSEYRMKDGKIRQVLWNQKAKEIGLEGVDVIKRYDGQGKGDEVVLMWRGEKIEEVKDVE